MMPVFMIWLSALGRQLSAKAAGGNSFGKKCGTLRDGLGAAFKD
jgi:hypothetical protein